MLVEVETNTAIICACAPALKAYFGTSATKSSRYYEPGSGFSKEGAGNSNSRSLSKGLHSELSQTASAVHPDATSHASHDSERNLVEMDDMQKGKSWPLSPAPGVIKSVTVDVESVSRDGRGQWKPDYHRFDGPGDEKV